LNFSNRRFGKAERQQKKLRTYVQAALPALSEE
jgi:hypothetical protein